MKILVTGADGFLGSNLVRELLSRQYQVRILAEPGRQTQTLQGLSLERAEGNLLNPADILKAIEGCDAIIHAAASTRVWPVRSEILNRINIDGTKNVVEAALQAGVKRMVYVGTANSLGFGTKEKPGDETQPYRSAQYGLDYMDSKYNAQQWVLKSIKERGLPAIIVNPTFMIGPFDSGPGPGAMILAIYHQKIPGYASGGRNYLYVKDAAVAIANALNMGRIGECHILGNANLSYCEAFSLIAGTIGVKAPRIKISPFFTKAYGLFGTVIGKITGKAPAVSYNLARIACDEHYFSAQKAIKELLLPQTPIEVGIKEAFQWFKENGYLNKK